MKKLLSLIGLCSILSGCITDMKIEDLNTDINLNTSLALPIGSVHANMMSLLDFVDSTYITTDTTNAICLLYEQNNTKLNVDLDTNFRKGEYLKETLSLSTSNWYKQIFDILPSNITSIPFPAGEFSFERHTTYNLNFNKNENGEVIQIDSAVIQQANVNFIVEIEGIELSEENYLTLSFHYPNLLDDEYNHKFENIHIYTNKYAFKETLNRFMAHFDKIEEGNLIDLSIEFTFHSKGTTTISRDAKIKFETEINLINTREVYGFVYFNKPINQGHISYNIPQDIFQNKLFAENNLLFSNPQIKIETITNAGLPLKLEISNVFATSGDKIEYALFNGQNYTSETLITPREPFDSATTTIQLDKNYGSLHKLLSMKPETINIDYKVTTPQKERVDSLRQFITLPLLAKLNLQAKIPFQFDPTTYFTYSDTLNANISSIVNQNQEIVDIIDIDSINIYLNINSSLPVNTSLKVIYLDEHDEYITESNTFTIPSALVDNEGRVTTPTHKELVLSASGETIENVYNTKKIVFELAIEGYDKTSSICFQASDAIDIKVGAFVKAKASISQSNNQ